MATSFLTAPHRWAADEFWKLVDNFFSFGEEFRTAFDSAVAAETDKLQALDELSIDLTASEISTVRVAVQNAAECHYSTHWQSFFREAIGKKHRMQAAIVIAAAIIAALLLFLVPKPPFAQLESGDVVLATPAVLAFLLLGAFALSRIPYRYEMGAKVFGATAAFVAIKTFSMWAPPMAPAWKTAVSRFSPIHPKVRMQIASLPAADIMRCALFFIGIIWTIFVIVDLINYLGKEIVSKEAGYTELTEQCSLVIVSLVDIIFLISNLLPSVASIDNDEYSDKPQENTGEHSEGLEGIWELEELDTRDWNVQWKALHHHLDNLAFVIKGPWQEAMRSRYRPAGGWIASHAPRIELFIRHQQTKNILASNNLIELANAMAGTLFHAVKGNWNLIGADEEYAEKAIAQRRATIIRRVIAIGISVVGAIVAPNLMHHYPVLYTQAVVITLIGFALVELLGLLDPDAPSRLDVASKLTSIIKRGG